VVTPDGVELFVEAGGVGHGILLVHGTTGDASHYWTKVAAALRTTHQVVLYDQRGFGRSGGGVVIDIPTLAADAAAVVEGCGIAPAAVVGFSLGGLVAQQLAARRPDLVSRLVLCSTAPRITPRLHLLGRVLGEVAAAGDRGVMFDLNVLLTHGEAHIIEAGEALEKARTAFVAAGRSWFGGALTAPATWDGVPAGAITCPTLVVAGDEDVEMPLRYARELASAFNGRLHVMEGRGHKCVVEDPAAFTEAVRTFLVETRG
jgi:pimeloyl-ACP methyl ester carboxylesterase